MKRVAVLGANGQLGRTIRSLTKNSKDDYSFFTKQDIDVTDKNNLESAFNTTSFDFCINCSAYTNVEAAETHIEEVFSINAEGVKNIAEVCNTYNTKLIHISTDYVFDGKKQSPYKTDDKTNPINQYGKSKLKGESYIQETFNKYFIIRTSWLYSAFGKNFVKTIINRIDENKALKITTEEEGTPTSCIDLSKFIFYVIDEEKMPYGIYNFSAQGSTSWYGFACEIANQYNSEIKGLISPTDHFKTQAQRPKYSVLNLSKTEKVYTKLDKWEISLKRVVEILKNEIKSKTKES